MQTKSNKYKVAQLWSQQNCPACEQAKQLLQKHQIAVDECKLGQAGYTKEQLFALVPNARSVPQIFVDGFYIGGLQELKKLLHDNN